MALVEACAPAHVVIVASATESHVVGLNRATQHLRQAPVPRGLFDDSAGCTALASLASPECHAQVQTGGARATGMYLAFGAAGAVLRYAESQHGVVLAPGSLRVVFADAGSRMQVDPASVQALELVEGFRLSCPATPGPQQANGRPRANGRSTHPSLLSAVNSTRQGIAVNGLDLPAPAC